MAHIPIDPKLKAHYDTYYDGESEWRWLGAIDKANNIVKLCREYSHRTIIEIGSGEGSILKRLCDLQFGEELYSIEISKSAVEAVRSRDIPSLVECVTFDGTTIPYEDGKFDLAVLTHVVEHVEYPRRIIYEASRVAKYVFLEVPLEDNHGLAEDYVPDKVGHINFYTWKTIRRLVQTCNLEVLSQSISCSSYSAYRYLRGKKAVLWYLPKQVLIQVMPGLATSLWTYNCSLLCRKKEQ